MSLLDGFFSLGRDINKAKENQETAEGASSVLIPELALEMEDSELLELKQIYEKKWENSEARKELEKAQKTNEDYWKGKHHNAGGSAIDKLTSEERPLADNLIFESLETFLPRATRKNPEPVVTGTNDLVAKNTQKILVHLADTLRMKLKIKQAVRNWAIYHLGVMKLGWSETHNEITMTPIRPQRLILDPDATIDVCEYTGDLLGEIKEDTARNLIKRFPAKEAIIKEEAKDKLGTEIKYVEWWNNEYLFWTLKKEVLGKSKNPHWNYDDEQITTDLTGVQTSTPVAGKNHFDIPKIPYVFLSVFNLGLHPFDETSLIQQNIALNDMINKRLTQIDKNADNTNNGIAVSGDYFTKEQAKQAADALRRGVSIWIPQGDVNKAIARMSGTALPQFIYQSLVDYRNELRSIFGTTGLTPQGLANEQTVRGKIVARTSDDDRIGGGITEYIEQFADHVFNWMVQLMYVYYDEPHKASIVGVEKVMEEAAVSMQELGDAKLTISVKEGSLVPTDNLTKRNEAIDLWGAGALDPITLFDRLEFPNPKETALKLYQWVSNPAALFPEAVPPQILGPDGMPIQSAPPVETTNAMEEQEIANEVPSENVSPSLNQVPIQ